MADEYLKLKIKENLKKIPTGVGILAFAIGAPLLHEAINDPANPLYQDLAHANELINNFRPLGVGLGHYFISFVRYYTDVISQLVTITDPDAPETVKFIDSLLLGSPIAAGALGAVDWLRNYFGFNKNILAGREPLKKNLIPSHVIVSSSQSEVRELISQATKTGRLSNKKNKPVVLIHSGREEIPLEALEEKQISYHFGFEDITELIGSEESSKEVPPLIKDSGLDRSPEITIYCMPDIYGTGKDMQFPPDKVYLLVATKLGKLKGRVINVIMPRIGVEDEVTRRYTRFEEQLRDFQKRLEKKNEIKFILNIFSPEAVFSEIIRLKLVDFALGKKRGEPVNILHIEQSPFKGAYEEQAKDDESPREVYIRPESMISSLIRSISSLREIGDHEIRPDHIEFSLGDFDLLKIQEVPKLTERFKKADYVVFTAESDHDAVIMVEKLVTDFPVLKGKIMVIVDKKKTAERINELNLLVETFVPSEEVIKAFNKHEVSKNN